MTGRTYLTGDPIILNVFSKGVLVTKVAKFFKVPRILPQHFVKIFLSYGGGLNKRFSLNIKLNRFFQKKFSLANHKSLIVISQKDII